MSRVSALLSRIAAACALLLVAALLAPGGSASAAPTAGELSYACALKSNGLLRAVGSLSECKGNETRVTLKPGPHTVCIQPSGSTRLATKPKDCKAPATLLTLPPLSGTVYFCAALPSGTLRFVTGPGPVPRRRGAGPGDAQRRRAQRDVHEPCRQRHPRRHGRQSDRHLQRARERHRQLLRVRVRQRANSLRPQRISRIHPDARPDRLAPAGSQLHDHRVCRGDQ